MPHTVDLLAYIGGFYLFCVVTETLWNIICGLKAHVIPRLRDVPTDLVEKYGTWAVVTGSTDGIGKAYAKELAKRGLNIVLISRSVEKLNKVANEITTIYQVKTKIIVADFSQGQEIYQMIAEELKDIPIGILVNNVGKQYAYPMYLSEVPEKELWDIININVGATTAMTRFVLPQMVDRRKGAIVNVSSSAEFQPLPLMTVYAASKVFMKSFTDALRIEYQSRGITIQNVSPLFVNTKMNAFSHRLQESTLFVPDAETYAQNAINTLGEVSHTTGYWSHGVQNFGMMLSPMWMRMYVGGMLNQVFRQDYLKNCKLKDIPAL
ncbi:inactive hydroxysteroid dehydrogenase-like protein 1 [Nilaparvata lugens]|uniref:inactive hydroxysteroid dehydrogenase-like protein 1 n=1 Tax=Nilaparvata lugens TaxID=108931 RepID=UPI000B988A44|nr:inactive hydroxysteroid dehydrogenase-like protein 1 [Nilaparvata lugens]